MFWLIVEKICDVEYVKVKGEWLWNVFVEIGLVML